MGSQRVGGQRGRDRLLTRPRGGRPRRRGRVETLPEWAEPPQPPGQRPPSRRRLVWAALAVALLVIAGVVVVLIVRAGGPKPSAGPVESFPPPTRGPKAAAPSFQVLGYVGEGRLSRPMGVAVDPQGHIYVADQGSGRVQRFLADGTFDRAFGEI